MLEEELIFDEIEFDENEQFGFCSPGDCSPVNECYPDDE